MTIALLATLFVIEFRSLLLIGVAALLGAVIGAISAQRVKMTAMPQMVAAYNGVGGGAAALIALSEFYHMETGGPEDVGAAVPGALNGKMEKRCGGEEVRCWGVPVYLKKKQ